MQDLSNLANSGWPSFGASMAGGNTVTEPPHSNDALKPAPGSTSEGTADIINATIPDLEIPTDKYRRDIMDGHAGPVPSSDQVWKKINLWNRVGASAARPPLPARSGDRLRMRLFMAKTTAGLMTATRPRPGG